MSRRTAFTLIEALVVTAVIALLVGLMVPGLARARDAARATSCAAAARELQTANLAHAADRDERFVAGAPEIEGQNLERWHGRRAAPGESFSPEGAALTGYLGAPATSEALRECAAFRVTDDLAAPEGFERGAGGYGYNNAFVGAVRTRADGGAWTIETNREGSRSSRFRRPDATIAFTDAAFAGDGGLVEYSFAEPPEWPEYPGARPDPSIHFRHGGAASVAWLDGHVSREKRAFSAWSQLYTTDPSPLGLGWFGDEADGNALFDYR